MDWSGFEVWWSQYTKDQLRFSDIQDENQKALAGREVTVTLPVLMTYIGDVGRASSQKLLPMVNSNNKLSTQSAQPLSATDAGSDATISIASHSVQFGFGTVSYNSGSIAGLAFSTLYYVYVSDPTYAGGAVTYLSTTNANLVTSNDGYYYVGKVTTPANGAGDTGGGWGGGGGGGGSQIPALLIGASMMCELSMHFVSGFTVGGFGLFWS